MENAFVNWFGFKVDWSITFVMVIYIYNGITHSFSWMNRIRTFHNKYTRKERKTNKISSNKEKWTKLITLVIEVRFNYDNIIPWNYCIGIFRALLSYIRVIVTANRSTEIRKNRKWVEVERRNEFLFWRLCNRVWIMFFFTQTNVVYETFAQAPRRFDNKIYALLLFFIDNSTDHILTSKWLTKSIFFILLINNIHNSLLNCQTIISKKIDSNLFIFCEYLSNN